MKIEITTAISTGLNFEYFDHNLIINKKFYSTRANQKYNFGHVEKHMVFGYMERHSPYCKLIIKHYLL